MTSAVDSGDRPSAWSLVTRPPAIALLAFCLWWAWSFPVAHALLAIGLAVYFVVLLRWPSAWLIVLPASIPALELTFWSGRLFFSEFDLLVLTTLAAGLWRRDAWLRHIDAPTRVIGVLLLASQIAVTVHGLLPLHTPVPDAWTDYFASTNALREFRGVLWALLLWPMLGAARGRGDDLQRLVAIGMLGGLTIGIASVVWERGLFTGLFDFSHPYRISGWFFSMHTGGAAIDAFLALAAPFALAPLLLWRHPGVRAATPVLLVLSLYAFYVTYSRANYPALFVMLMTLGWGLVINLVRQSDSVWRPNRLVLLVGGSLSVLILIAIAVLLGPQIQNRFDSTPRDLRERLQHWDEVLDVLRQQPDTWLAGRGKGRYPGDFYWYSQGAGKHLALAQHHSEDGQGYIRFSRSDRLGNLFLQQRFTRTTSDNYVLKLKLRTPKGSREALLIEFCERHILKYLAECRWRKVKAYEADGEWHEYATHVSLSGLGLPRFGPFARPLDVSLMNRGIGTGMDIGYAQLLTADGTPLLGNPDFANGWDHWFLSYGDHLRWHIKNVFVYWLYEGGLAHVILMSGLMLFVLARLALAAGRGDLFALLSVAALAGALMVGLFDSLFDDPKIALSFFLLSGAGMIGRPVNPLPVPRLPAGLTRRHLMIAANATLATIALLVVLRLLAPALFKPLENRVALWAEQRGPKLAALLGVDFSEITAAQIAALRAPWQPLPDAPYAPPGQILIGEQVFTSLSSAARSLRSGQHMVIGAGVYRSPMLIKADDVRISGSGHVVIERTQVQGKAAIVTSGHNVLIENLECRHISVGDRNGACVRQQGRDLTLRHVYFHDAEQGVLTAPNPGRLQIIDSRFERLGKLGRAHGVYMSGGTELIIEDSDFLAMRSWGHAIKSRAAVTRILRSTLASLASNDSRLLDLPHGGELEIRDSVLEQGPNSSNADAIGFALERGPHAVQQVTISGSVVILERDGSIRLLNSGDVEPTVHLSNNLFVGVERREDAGDNRYLDSREQAGIPPYPQLPAIAR